MKRSGRHSEFNSLSRPVALQALAKGVAVSRRTLQRAVQPYRQALKAEALGTTRFLETPPGRQLQIDFRKRLVEIGGAKVKAFVFVATLGHSRRLHGRAFREHWFAGLESTFTTLSRMALEVLMDNPRAVVVRHDAVSRSVQFKDKLIAFAKHWVSVLAPARHIGRARRARLRTASAV
ncbi:transposase [Bradyrhizobium sp. F1.13.1]